MAAVDKLERVDITVDGVKTSVVGGSFRGVSFFVEDYERRGGGRNVVSHAVPFSDDFKNQDLGGKIPAFSLEVYLIGDECKQARDNLIAACNEEGPGELVHPFFGRFMAECADLSFRGSRTGVNYCTATVEFRPASASEGKAVKRDLAGVTKKSALDFQDSSVSKFASVFSVVGKAKAVVDKAVAVTDKAMDSVLSSRTVLATANDFVSAVGKIKANAAVMMLAPADFAARVRDLITATKEIFGIEEEGDDVDEYLNMLNSMRDSDMDGSPAGRISALVRDLTAAQLMSSLVDARFSNVDDAAGCQQRVSDAFDALLDSVSDVDDYMALSNLQSAAFGYLRDASANIAVVLEKEITYSNNALQLCYDVYGNCDRVDEIMSRNQLIQGLFVLPGKVRVLSK